MRKINATKITIKVNKSNKLKINLLLDLTKIYKIKNKVYKKQMQNVTDLLSQ